MLINFALEDKHSCKIFTDVVMPSVQGKREACDAQ